jgi:ADP-ribose pyrophosphatase YjhB (NUDIX family)
VNKNSETPADLAQKLALWSDTLRDCSARGLQYASNIYDRDNYQKIQDLALEMLATAAGQSLAEFEPLRAILFSRPAPVPVGDAAIIDESGRILLIRRSDNHLWAMPGGGLEVGETPAEGVIREALEETGIACEPLALIGVYDSLRNDTPAFQHLYHFLFLCRPLPGTARIDPPSHAHEVLETHWFPQNILPDDLDPSHMFRILDAFRVWSGDLQAFFDPLE